MAAPHGLRRRAGAALASVTMALTLLTSARAETRVALERLNSAPDASGWLLALTPPFSTPDTPPVVLIDVGRTPRFVVVPRPRATFAVGYLDLPLIPARGSGMFAFVGTSTQSLGGFRLHF